MRGWLCWSFSRNGRCLFLCRCLLWFFDYDRFLRDVERMVKSALYKGQVLSVVIREIGEGLELKMLSSIAGKGLP